MLVAFGLTLVAGSGQLAFAAKEPYTIGISSLTRFTDWCLYSLLGMQDMAEELGFELIICEANNDPAKQNEDIHRLVRRKVDVITISLCQAGTLDSAIAAAGRAGIPIISNEAWLRGPTVMSEVASKKA